jgi:hypothetical protein
MSETERALARAVATDFYRHFTEAEWSRLEPTRRSDLVRDQLAHLPFGTRRLPEAGTPVRVGASGSGEDLLVLAWSERDLARERRAGTRMLAHLGIARATPIANTLPGALAAPGSLLFGDVVEEHGALDVPLGAIESDAAAKAAWELLDRVTPAIVCLESATAARFLAAAPAAPRSWLSGILWLRRSAVDGVSGPIPENVGFSGWQRQWLAVAEASSFVAASCAVGGLHADDRVLVEIADATTGSPVADDESGVLLLTPLDGETALLRYDTGLRARRRKVCACGTLGTAFDLV